MLKNQVALAALIVATATAPAAAQTQPSNTAPAAQNQPSTTVPATQNRATAGLDFITRRDANTWRASELIGKDVYGSNNEDIGEIGDVLLNRSGQVVGVVLDVGGFLGLGETNVAVPMHALQFQQNTGQTAGSTATTGSTGTTGTNPATTGARTGQGADANAPDRIVLIVTKQQLQSAPKFEDKDRASTGSTQRR